MSPCHFNEFFSCFGKLRFTNSCSNFLLNNIRNSTFISSHFNDFFLVFILGDRDELRGDKDLDVKKDTSNASKDEPMDVDDVKPEDKKESATVEASS